LYNAVLSKYVKRLRR